MLTFQKIIVINCKEDLSYNMYEFQLWSNKGNSKRTRMSQINEFMFFVRRFDQLWVLFNVWQLMLHIQYL